jgi:clan AA aspartic protease
MYLCIPRHVAIQLGLSAHEQREMTLADGTRAPVDYVGPVEVRFANRRCFVGAMVLGDEVLLGAIPMEDMDLGVHPQSQQVTVHPDRPNIAAGIAKLAA